MEVKKLGIKAELSIRRFLVLVFDTLALYIEYISFDKKIWFGHATIYWI